MDFNGKTAIVTGAGRGLGLSYARELARLGAHVLISDIGADRQGAAADASVAHDAAQALAAQGYSVIGHHGELVSETGCRQLVETAVEAFGRLDIVIHNAGWVGYQAIEEAQPELSSARWGSMCIARSGCANMPGRTCANHRRRGWC